MSTRTQYVQAILEVLYPRDPVTRLLPIPLTGTSDGTTATIVCTTLQTGLSIAASQNANRYDGYFAEIAETQSGAPPVGEGRAVIVGGYASDTGTITVAPAFSLATDNTMDFLLYPKGWTQSMFVQAIDAVMRLTDAPQLWFPSIFDDADFAAASLTAWADVGSPSPATSFVTAAANVLLGERAIYVQADASGEGVESNPAEVTEGEQLIISVVVQVESGTCTVELYNVSSTKVIKAVTIDEQEFTEVRFSEAIPDDCEQVSVRFLSNAPSDKFYISPTVIGQPSTERDYPAPSWIRQKNVEKAFSMPQGITSEDADSYIALSRRIRDSVSYRLSRSERDVTPQRVSVRTVGGQPTGFLVHRALSALAAGSDSSPLDLDYVAARALQNLFERRQDSEWLHWRDRAKELASTLGYGKRAIGVESSGEVAV